MTRKASVTWELSQEGVVVVDVDTPARPFGDVTPVRGVQRGDLAVSEDTEPDGPAVEEDELASLDDPSTKQP